MKKNLTILILIIFILNSFSCKNFNDHYQNEYMNNDNKIESEDNNKFLVEETTVLKTEESKKEFSKNTNDYNLLSIEEKMERLLTLDTESPKEFNENKIFNDVKEYPKVDGSTALLPLMAKIMENTCGINENYSKELTTCSKTAGAWLNLAEGSKDLLIVGNIPEEIKYEIIDDYNSRYKYKEFLYTPIRREGLIFIVNKDNPVDSLTEQQLIDIYTGKITNWKDIGGDDVEIKAFQRNENSGSQTYFLNLLMKDVVPTKAEVDMYIPSMGGLIESIASYDNSKNAIGYSVFYYATYMYANDDLKMIKVNGIEPSNETIANGSYPLVTESLLAIRKDEDKNSSTYKLYDYIKSNKGREIIRNLGYVPVE